VHVYVHVYMYVHMYMYLSVHMYVHLYVHVHVHVCTCVYMRVHVCTYVCLDPASTQKRIGPTTHVLQFILVLPFCTVLFDFVLFCSVLCAAKIVWGGYD